MSRRTVRERLDEVYRRLAAMPRAATADDAFRELCDVLDAVEDLWSGVPKKSPPPWPADSDGRMYCPSTDFTWQRGDGSILALTRGHRIEISGVGALRIRSKITGLVEFEK